MAEWIYDPHMAKLSLHNATRKSPAFCTFPLRAISAISIDPLLRTHHHPHSVGGICVHRRAFLRIMKKQKQIAIVPMANVIHAAIKLFISVFFCSD